MAGLVMDQNAGKYHKLYPIEFAAAQRALAGEDGKLSWGTHDYEAFTFKKAGVFLVFYPHRTSTGNRHIRVRNSGSRDRREAERLMTLLDESQDGCCTFTVKSK